MAARHIRGTPTIQITLWKVRAASRGGKRDRSPCPWTAAHSATVDMARREKLVPAGPNRTAPQSRGARSRTKGNRERPPKDWGSGAGAAKTRMATTSVVSAKRMASPTRATRERRTAAAPPSSSITIAGTQTSSVSVFAKNRLRHTVQNCSPRCELTIHASGNEESSGAISTAPTRNTAIPLRVSKRLGRRSRPCMHHAARTASLQFVTYSARIIPRGQPVPSCTARCAGNAAAR
jgi:hypothetical protein